MYSRVPECQVTTYYYVGFAYLMMRRYQDAIRVFANILLYIQRTKSMFQRTTYKYEMVRALLTVFGKCHPGFCYFSILFQHSRARRRLGKTLGKLTVVQDKGEIKDL